MTDGSPLFLEDPTKIAANPPTRRMALFSILIEAKDASFSTPFIRTLPAGVEIGQTSPILSLDYGMDGGAEKMADGGP